MPEDGYSFEYRGVKVPDKYLESPPTLCVFRGTVDLVLEHRAEDSAPVESERYRYVRVGDLWPVLFQIESGSNLINVLEANGRWCGTLLSHQRILKSRSAAVISETEAHKIVAERLALFA